MHSARACAWERTCLELRKGSVHVWHMYDEASQVFRTAAAGRRTSRETADGHAAGRRSTGTGLALPGVEAPGVEAPARFRLLRRILGGTSITPAEVRRT